MHSKFSGLLSAFLSAFADGMIKGFSAQFKM